MIPPPPTELGTTSPPPLFIPPPPTEAGALAAPGAVGVNASSLQAAGFPPPPPTETVAATSAPVWFPDTPTAPAPPSVDTAAVLTAAAPVLQPSFVPPIESVGYTATQLQVMLEARLALEAEQAARAAAEAAAQAEAALIVEHPSKVNVVAVLYPENGPARTIDVPDTIGLDALAEHGWVELAQGVWIRPDKFVRIDLVERDL